MNRCGMSLLEVVVAMAVLATGASALAAGAAQAQRAAASSDGLTSATALAEGLLARARASAQPKDDQGELQPGGFRWRIAVEPGTLQGLTRITVEVDYPLAGAGRTATHRLVGASAARTVTLLDR